MKFYIYFIFIFIFILDPGAFVHIQYIYTYYTHTIHNYS